MTVKLVPLTVREIELVEIIQSSEEWMSRDDIARADNKAQLSPHDQGLLDRLVTKGLILKQVSQAANQRPKFIYKAV